VLAYGVNPGGGKWYNSTVPGYTNFQWKGDTSSDEITGHMNAYPWVLELGAVSSNEQQRAYNLHINMVNYIVKNNYTLIDADGQRTTWVSVPPFPRLAKRPFLNSSFLGTRGSGTHTISTI